MFWGMLICFMLAFHFIVLFKNGIELNEITIEFSILYICCCILIILLARVVQKGLIKRQALLALALIGVIISVISYTAITEIPEDTITKQMKLATILGNSFQFKNLEIEKAYDIESIIFHGSPKHGSFDQELGYVVELILRNEKKVYYFKCQGTGPDCNQFIQVEKPFELD